MIARNTTEPERPFTGRLAEPPAFYLQWMLAGNPARFFERLIRDHGDFIRYRGVIGFHLINHPALVHQVLKSTHRQYDKNSHVYNRFRNAFGDGLVTAEGERWKRQRKLLQPLFGPASIRRFFDLMREAATGATERWSARAEDGQVFNIAREMERLTLEIAGRSFFSQAFDQTADRISRWTRAINRYCAIPPLPVISDLRFPSPLNLRLRGVLREYREFLRDLIRERMIGDTKDDLLGVLLTAKDEESGEVMSEDELAEEVLGMIIGGRPSRFDSDQPENPESSHAHIPFGSGPRVCIGRHFALMELTVILVIVLQRYRVTADASDRHEMAARVTMVPKHGLKVRLEPRPASPSA